MGLRRRTDSEQYDWIALVITELGPIEAIKQSGQAADP